MMTKIIKNHIWFILLSLIYFIFIIFTYKSFGITDDEFVEYRAGKSLLNFYQTGEERNFNLSNTHLPSNALYFRVHLAIYNFLNPNFYYEVFHLLNFIFSYFLILGIYLLFYSYYQNKYYSLIPVLMLILTPRVFGDFPANPKDIPFAIFFFFSLFLIYLLQKRFSFFLLVFLGICIGVASSLRLIGLSLVFIFFFYHLIYSGKLTINFVKYAFLLVFIVLLTQFVSLPYLWSDTVNKFINLITQSSSFSLWNNTNLYFGEFIGKEVRSRGYLFVWIGITTPIFILGLYFWSLTVLKKVKENSLLLLFNLAIFINLLLYIVINPVIYNGPRHFIFVLMLISLQAATFLIDLLKKLPVQKSKLLLSIFVVHSLFILLFYFKFHPYYYVYFNELVGQKNAQGQFDYDYWGASYKEMVQILKNDSSISSKDFSVYPCSQATGVVYFSEGKFKVVSKVNEANFIVCDIDSDKREGFRYPIYGEVKRDNITIGIIRKVQ